MSEVHQQWAGTQADQAREMRIHELNADIEQLVLAADRCTEAARAKAKEVGRLVNSRSPEYVRSLEIARGLA